MNAQDLPNGRFSFRDRASLVTLARSDSPLGDILRSMPERLLRAADRWAEKDFQAQQEAKVPWRRDYLPLPDPWRYLLDSSDVALETKKVFRAAQSWLIGLRTLCRLATGFATLSTDWYQEAAKARAKSDKRRENYALAKLANKFVLNRATQEEALAQQDPKLSKEVEGLLKIRRAQIMHRSQWQRKTDAFEPIMETTEIEKQFPIEYRLVDQWLCFPSGPWPGLMFWSNRAITKWIFASLGQNLKTRYKQLGRDHIKKVRQRLGLRPVSGKTPLVWDIDVKPLSSSGLEIKALNRKGEMVFTGKFIKRK